MSLRAWVSRSCSQKRAVVIRQGWEPKQDEHSYCIDSIHILRLTLDSISRAFSSCASFNIFSISSIFSASIPLALWTHKASVKVINYIERGIHHTCLNQDRQQTFKYSSEICATVQWFYPSVIYLVNDGMETSSSETGGLRNVSSYMKIQLDCTYITSMKICHETWNEAHVDYKQRKIKCVMDYSREESQTSLKLHEEKSKQTVWEHFK